MTLISCEFENRCYVTFTRFQTKSIIVIRKIMWVRKKAVKTLASFYKHRKLRGNRHKKWWQSINSTLIVLPSLAENRVFRTVPAYRRYNKFFVVYCTQFWGLLYNNLNAEACIVSYFNNCLSTAILLKNLQFNLSTIYASPSFGPLLFSSNNHI